MDGAQLFNVFEAAFWLGLAFLVATTGHRTAGFTPRRQVALFMLLVGFGVSDIWEVYSGAWWQPRSLLLLKATCLIGLIVTAVLIYGSRWKFGKEIDPGTAEPEAAATVEPSAAQPKPKTRQS